MEDSRVTDSTIDIMTRIRLHGLSNIGVVLQGRLFPTISDIERICDRLGERCRLPGLQGIYLEPEEIAYTEYNDIVNATNSAIEAMLDRGAYTAIASHDYQ